MSVVGKGDPCKATFTLEMNLFNDKQEDKHSLYVRTSYFLGIFSTSSKHTGFLSMLKCNLNYVSLIHQSRTGVYETRSDWKHHPDTLVVVVVIPTKSSS